MKKLLVFSTLLVALLLCLTSCKHEHSFGEWSVTKNATCTEDGVKTRYCDCGEKQSDTLPATGHAQQIVPAKAATCYEAGLTEGVKCTNCNAILVAQQETPVTAHAFDDKYDDECNACGHKREVECAHLETEVILGKAATCTATGLTDGEKCKKCGEILVAQQETPVIAHTYDDKYDDECNVCGHKRDAECAHLETEVIPGKAATCTAAGLTDGEKCKKCGETLISQTVIPVKDHTEVIDAAVESTCTSTGLTEGKHCSACSKVLVAQNVTEMKPHTEVVDAEVPATCTATGLTEGKHCSQCSEIFVAQQEIPMVPHTYDNQSDDTCNVCGFVRESGVIKWDGTVSNSIRQGSGTEQDPYIIQSPQELAFLSAKVLAGDTTYASAYYVQANDFDMMGFEWTPIGNTEKDLYGQKIGTPFSGNYDGNNHFIKNVVISQETLSENTGFGWKSYAGGFFGGLSNATVKNLEITDMNVNITYTSTLSLSIQYGCLAGKVVKSIIDNCHVTGNIVIESKSLRTTDFYVGGFVGSSETSTITNSNSEVSITIDAAARVGRDVGGFIGQSGFYNEIIDCSSGNNTISLTYGNAFSIVCGGFVGNNAEEIRNCYVYNCSIIAKIGDSSYSSENSSTNIVSIGGFCGQNGLVSLQYPSQGDAGGKIFNSYADCDLEVRTNADHVYVGGFVGANKLWEGTKITDSISIGNINLTSSCNDTAMGCFAGLIDTSSNTNYAISDNQYLLNGNTVSYNSSLINKTDLNTNYISNQEITDELLIEILGYVPAKR